MGPGGLWFWSLQCASGVGVWLSGSSVRTRVHIPRASSDANWSWQPTCNSHPGRHTWRRGRPDAWVNSGWMEATTLGGYSGKAMEIGTLLTISLRAAHVQVTHAHTCVPVYLQTCVHTAIYTVENTLLMSLSSCPLYHRYHSWPAPPFSVLWLLSEPVLVLSTPVVKFTSSSACVLGLWGLHVT